MAQVKHLILIYHGTIITNLTFPLLHEDPFVLKMQAIAQQQNPAYNCVFRIELLHMLDYGNKYFTRFNKQLYCGHCNI